jgi:hypothetical protein
MTEWLLWIDESGDFEDPRQYASVTGVLVRSGVVGFSKVKLRRLFAEACGYVPWPVHRWLLNASVMHGVWAVRAADGDGSPLDRRVRAVVAALHRMEPGAFEAVVRRLDQGWEPRGPDIEALEAAFRTLAPWQMNLLRRMRRQCWEAVVGGLGAALRIGADDPEQSAADSVWLVAAGESENGDAVTAGTLGDRYLHLLGCLAHRVADILIARGGVNRVAAHVAMRNVFDARLRSRDALSPPLVDEAIREGLGTPDATVRRADGALVQITCQQVLRFRADSPAGLVLADWGANAFRWASTRRVSLGRVQAQLGHAVGLPVSRLGLPTIASTGRPWSALLDRGEADAGRSRDRPWAWEQAEAWRRTRTLRDEVGRR